VHRLQAEAEHVKTSEILAVLTEFHRDRLTARQRHAAVAHHVGNYSFNNTYQYIIAREDVHLSWLEAALRELGVTPEQIDEPVLASPGKKADSFLPLAQEDARDAEAFASRWRERIASVTNARHRSMLGVIIGEVLEHKRFFDQMTAGRDDLLGRRMDGAGTGNGVLGVRWLE
jgi:hypothetical protein